MLDNGRCTRKHHVTLHKSFGNHDNRQFNGNFGRRNGNYGNNRSFKRNNTHFNEQRALNILANPTNTEGNVASQATVARNQVTSQPQQETQISSAVQNIINSAPTISQLPENRSASFNNAAFGNKREARPGTSLQSLSTQNGQVDQTVKVFKTKFFGTNGCLVGYSVGDSGAEVTLMREDMRTMLGLEGTKCKLPLQWIDGSTKYVEAIKVDLQVQGVLNDSPKLLLRNCYALSDFKLASRSLNVEKMKMDFPYLNNVEFESYVDVSPCLLIGSCHASVIESTDKLLEDGEDKPVGLKARLGWTIYGGCSDKVKDIKIVGYVFVNKSKALNDCLSMEGAESVCRTKLPLVYLPRHRNKWKP
jgi:hypothetical protein